MEPISTNAPKAQVIERLGWERRSWVKFLYYTQDQAKKIASFDESLWKGVPKCDMKTYLEVPDHVMKIAHENVNNWLVQQQGLERIGKDIFEWRMKQALYYELKKRRDATAVTNTPVSDSQSSKYYDPVKDSAGPLDP
ncbi:hypothetical protein B0J12DRAFT_746832 [Macrophomina phaseolina]|uniref:Uncharacterized protein n=1 Tax=Macrophomina phaseolina TaxID=35725 RepID=A0ABQ8FRI5_9PEZI|nr:hypothetical protein B0J12DRAFT_746832 [Macrophomina phaseolina]